jgi:hypothetical protein
MKKRDSRHSSHPEVIVLEGKRILLAEDEF